MSLSTWTRTAADYCAAVETGLAGKCVVVTGASGGIGSACARAFAAVGAHVAVHFHRGRERAEAVAAELGDAPVIGADLTDEGETQALFEEARDRPGRRERCPARPGARPRPDQPG